MNPSLSNESSARMFSQTSRFSLGGYSNRDSSVELLRLLLMFMIVVHHLIVHGLGLSGFSVGSETPVLIPESECPLFITVNIFCICAVNCFVLISGYYGIRPSVRKVSQLLFAVVFYTLLLSTSLSLYEGHWDKVVTGLMILSHSPYWFIVDYLLLMMFAPVFNTMFERMSNRYCRLLIVVMLFVGCYLGFIWGFKTNVDGYSLFQFFTMYCVGRYFKVNSPAFVNKLSGIGWLMIYLVSSSVIVSIAVLAIVFGKGTWAWHAMYYNNPLLMISAIALFFVFHRLRFHSRLINIVSLSALAVYLFQSSPYISDWLYGVVGRWCENVMEVKYWGAPSVLVFILLMSAAVLIISLLVDRVRIYCWNALAAKLNRRFDGIDSRHYFG